LPKRGAPKRVPFGLFKYVVDEDRVVIGGATSNGGNLRQWLLRELKLSETAQKKALSRTAAAMDDLAVLPFWVGERAPTWPEDLRGTITGLSAATTAIEILRAATTSTYYRLTEILTELNRSLGERSEIIVSGGVLHSPAALPILADCLGQDLRVCRELESSLRGAAIHALEKMGFESKPVPVGRLVRHQPALTAQHVERRRRQENLERRLR
jgi:gluconokinase